MPQPWYAPPVVPDSDEEELGWYVYGLWIPRATVIPTDEFPYYYERRILRLVTEYARFCKLTGSQFPIIRAFELDGPRLHADAWAIDIIPTDGWTLARMAAQAMELWWLAGSRLYGVKLRDDYLHLDIFPRRKRALGKVKKYYGTRIRQTSPY